MKKISQVLWVWLLLSLAVYAQADSGTINPNWSELSQAEYVENLVACELKLQAHKWSKNVWPDNNKKAKPKFSEVVDVDQVWGQVIDNLTMQTILADYFNTSITDQMLQHDLDRMAKNTQDAKGLKALFALFDHNPNTIAQCVSRPYLVKQKMQNNYNFNSEIHANTKTLAQTELKAYLAGDDSDSLKAQVSTLTFEIEQADPKKVDQEKAVDDFAEEYIMTLSAEAFNEKIVQLQHGSLQEKDQGYMYSEILSHSDDSIRTKTLFWPKAPLSVWLEQQSAEIYQTTLKNTSLHLPVITGENNLSAVKAGVDGGIWESRFYVPSVRNRHTAVWSGSEMIIWGGYNYNSDFSVNTGGRYNPTTDSWLATSGTNAPTRRSFHIAIWSGDEMIVWGGFDSTYLNTGGRYDPVSDSWTATSTGTNVPTGRRDHAAIWSGDEMIIWGGYNYNYGGFINTGGRYDPVSDTWTATSIDTNVPTGRTAHTAIWSGGEMIIWGGYNYNNGGYINTGGRYDPVSDTWTATSTGTNVPTGRSYHTAIWSGDEMIIWGGNDGSAYANTGGRYDPTTDSWTATSTGNNVPTSRNEHSAIWSGDEMIIWGGNDGSAYANTGGRYNPVTESWVATSTGANVPSSQNFYTAIWSGSEMIVWGGYDANNNGSIINTGGRYDPLSDSWTAIGTGDVSVPSARSNHAAVWSGHEMIIWGGYDGGYTNTGGRYNPTTDSWTATSTGANVPTTRSSHSAIWSGDEMIVWGGYDGSVYANTGGRYDPLSDSWTATSTGTNLPISRNSHSAIWSGDEMIIWGGYNHINGGYTNTGGLYDPVSDAWTATSTGANVPMSRSYHTAIWSGDEMIIWGGYNYNNGGYTNTGGRYDPVSDSWTATSIGTNLPTGCYFHTAIWSGDEMIVWGGYDGSGFVNTGGRYDPVTDGWTATSIGANVPTGRNYHTAVWSGHEMIIWGGSANGYATNTGGRYDPVSDSWTATSIGANVPTSRSSHSVIWSGDEMIIWGGGNGSSTNSLGIYTPYVTDLIFRDGFDGP
ncbi:MAG: hypothetical protein DWP95_13315 [Proteobacteria bacterium]|nr:MAG: hypothetical protein DWP95_13315 [Pseudomonadota bacterium]